MLLVVLVFEISMVTVAYRLEGNSASEIQSTMLGSLQQYSTRIEVARMWDDLHREFECCGARNRFDFQSDRIPVSCCHIDYGQVGNFTCTVTNAHTLGCASALGDELNYYAFVIAVSAVVATSLQVPLTALAAWMAYRAKYQEVELES
ncbi:CD63 antigen-like [Pectinophora gossypiella]|nr:CD63 antigen-like [Pectinophora gossypiella]